MVTEMPHHSALRCVSGIRQNNAKPLISNGLRFIATCLPTAAWWVLFQSRHSFAKIAKQKGIDNSKVKDLLAHSSLKITEGYMGNFDTSENDKALESVFEKEKAVTDESALLKQLQSLSPEALASLLAQVNR